MSCSFTKAEYQAVAATVAKVDWLVSLCHELWFSLYGVPRVMCGNVSVIYICENLVFHSHMKHVAIDIHFVNEQVQNIEVELKHLHSADQVADILIKSL